jgi:hypothetical protein
LNKKNIKKKIFAQIIVVLILASILLLFFAGYILGPDRQWIK